MWIHLSGPVRQLLQPLLLTEPVRKSLTFRKIVDSHKRIIDGRKENPSLGYLTSQPFMAVNVNLNGMREPCLQSDVHQAKSAVDEVVIRDSLRSFGENQSWPFLSTSQLDGATGLLHTQHVDQSLGYLLTADDILNDLFFAKLLRRYSYGPPAYLARAFA